MKKALKIFNWIFSIFCMLCLLAYGFNSGTILMFLLGIASLPVKSIREMWEKLPKHKVLRPVIIGFLFFMFMGMMPTTENGNTEQIAEIETETVTVTETKIEAATEIATEAVTETATETEQIEAESEAETEVQPEVVETESTESTQAVETAMVQTQASTEENLYASDIPANSVDAAEESNSTVEEAASDSELDTSNEKSDASSDISDEKSDTSNENVTSESSVISDSTSVNTSSDETNPESVQNQTSTTDLDSGNAVSSGDVSADAGSGSLMVWKTATGSKYHSTNHCGRTNPANATQITEEEAIRQGLGKCSKCW